MKVSVLTLGCKVNQAESAAIELELVSRGHELAGTGDSADAYIINTCCVTKSGDAKSRSAVRRARKINPDAVIAVCGCYSQISPDAVSDVGADIVTGTQDRLAVIGSIERFLETRLKSVSVPEYLQAAPTFERLTSGSVSGRTRALLKVQDGCENRCAYCIIPTSRGPVRSRPLEDASAESEQLALQGFAEIVVTGIEISSWGADLEGDAHLPDLIEAVCRSARTARVRLGSLEPAKIDLSFCRRLAALDNLCPHFHLPLQSGSDSVLLRMNRKYDTARFKESLDLLREAVKGCAITTDLIVGFPGESESEFDASIAFAARCGFSKMHVFPYSSRPGTPAAEMLGQITNAEKTRRARIADELSRKMAGAFADGSVGQIHDVLFERHSAGDSLGHAGNYLEVKVCGSAPLNVPLPVKITGSVGGILLGAVCD